MEGVAKRKWITPVLTVIVKGKPEETVLTSCKAPASPTGPGATNGECWKSMYCADCFNWVFS